MNSLSQENMNMMYECVTALGLSHVHKFVIKILSAKEGNKKKKHKMRCASCSHHKRSKVEL